MVPVPYPMTNEIYTWKCDNCNKVIRSMWARQFHQNVEAHKLSCTIKKGDTK